MRNMKSSKKEINVPSIQEDDEDAPEPWTWHEASLTLRELHDDLYGEPHASEMDLPQVHIQQPGTEGY